MESLVITDIKTLTRAGGHTMSDMKINLAVKRQFW